MHKNAHTRTCTCMYIIYKTLQHIDIYYMYMYYMYMHVHVHVHELNRTQSSPYEVAVLLIDTVVSEVHTEVAQLYCTSVLLCSKSSQSLLVHVQPQWVERGDSNIQPQVKLVPWQGEREREEEEEEEEEEGGGEEEEEEKEEEDS